MAVVMVKCVQWMQMGNLRSHSMVNLTSNKWIVQSICPSMEMGSWWSLIGWTVGFCYWIRIWNFREKFSQKLNTDYDVHGGFIWTSQMVDCLWPTTNRTMNGFWFSILNNNYNYCNIVSWSQSKFDKLLQINCPLASLSPIKYWTAWSRNGQQTLILQAHQCFIPLCQRIPNFTSGDARKFFFKMNNLFILGSPVVVCS